MTELNRFLMNGLLSPDNFPDPASKLEVFTSLFNVAFGTGFTRLSMSHLVNRILREPGNPVGWYTDPVIALPTHVKVEIPDLRHGAAVTVTFRHAAPNKQYTLMMVCEVGQPIVVSSWLHSTALAAFVQRSAEAGALQNA